MSQPSALGHLFKEGDHFCRQKVLFPRLYGQLYVERPLFKGSGKVFSEPVDAAETASGGRPIEAAGMRMRAGKRCAWR
jgi:hypothetical protein